MNRTVLSIAVAMTILIAGLASSACDPGPDANRNASLTTNRNAAPEPINTASIETELKKLEQDWANAFKTKDVEAVRRILADDVVLTYPDGTTGTKAEELQMVESGAITADSWETVESKVVVLDANTAFIAGRTSVKNGKLKHPKTQKMVDISGEYRFLDVFANRNGNWQVVASQATVVQPQP